MSTPRSIAQYGWIPDLPDERDHLFAAAPETMAALPRKIDLRPHCPAVYDQGKLGSCTANAIAGALQFDRLKEKLSDFTPSRLFIYYNERAIEGSVGFDGGAQLRDGIKAVNALGACDERDWPYDIARFAERPPEQAYRDALMDRALLYQRLPQATAQMRACLAAGYPFVFGFTVYESFETAAVAATGQASLPRPGERAVGGHAVMAVGYEDDGERFLVRNSWGAGWGMDGYFTLPSAYLLNPFLAADFWTIRLVGR